MKSSGRSRKDEENTQFSSKKLVFDSMSNEFHEFIGD